MKEQIRKQLGWMRFKAILKIIIPIGLLAAFFPTLLEFDTVEMVGILCTMGLLVPIYVISGILTLKNGGKQIKEYIQSYPGGEDALAQEYENGEKISGANIGQKHLFANASDGFFVVPFEKITKVFVRNEGANSAKGRPGYYYLYVECGKIGGSDERIKIYYISQSSAYEARDLLMLKTGIVKE